MTKIKFFFLFFIVILFFQFINADTTFFDNEEDVFIIGNPMITSSEITGIIKENELNGAGGCITNWICSDWSSCINNRQTRNCAKEKSYCYTDLNKKPIESQNCSIEKQNEMQGPQTKEKDKKIMNFIFVFIILAIIILFLYKIYRKTRRFKYGY